MDTLIPIREQRDNDLVRLLLKHKYYLVELVRLYSNPEAEVARLRLVLSAAATPRPPQEPKRHRRQRQHRLSMTEITKLINAYEQQETIKALAQRFGIHRLTVTALLRRHGVELRRGGLAQEDIQAAANLYGQGWSLARLGKRFGVDSTTVWRALRSADVPMRPSGQHESMS